MIKLLNESPSLDSFNSTITEHPDLDGEPVTLKWYDGDKLVGTILVDTEPASDGYMWFGSFEVDPEYRGMGIGTQILGYAMDEYRAGALGVRKDNKTAIGLYRKMGFKGRGDDYTEDGIPYMRMYYEPNRIDSGVAESR